MAEAGAARVVAAPAAAMPKEATEFGSGALRSEVPLRVVSGCTAGGYKRSISHINIYIYIYIICAPPKNYLCARKAAISGGFVEGGVVVEMHE